MKVKRANRLMSIIDEIWVIHLQKVDTLLINDWYKVMKMSTIDQGTRIVNEFHYG